MKKEKKRIKENKVALVSQKRAHEHMRPKKTSIDGAADLACLPRRNL
jgi:hypothetical protein